MVSNTKQKGSGSAKEESRDKDVDNGNNTPTSRIYRAILECWQQFDIISNIMTTFGDAANLRSKKGFVQGRIITYCVVSASVRGYFAEIQNFATVMLGILFKYIHFEIGW